MGMQPVIDFFKNLPWYILYPGKAVAAAAGGYVSQHPEIFPSWVVLLGAAVALWVVLAFLWHALNSWREHSGKAKLKLDPQLILILFLVAALGAAIWQWLRLPVTVPQNAQVAGQALSASNDSQITELQSQLDAAKTQLEETRKDLAETKKALPSAEDVLKNKLRFRSEQIRVFREDFERRVVNLRQTAEAALNATRQETTTPPPAAVPRMMGRLQASFFQEVSALQIVCDNFFGEKVRLTPVEADRLTLTNPVPGDDGIKNYDDLQKYRIFWWKKRSVEDAIRDLLQRLDTESSQIARQVSELK
jgi:preprotein translocase subunit Sec61beta